MKDRRLLLKRIYSSVFMVAALALIVYICLSESKDGTYGLSKVHDFSSGWKSLSGQELQLDDAVVGVFADKPVLLKKLPDGLTEDDALCFESVNVDFNVYLDNVKIYTFTARENISGSGYGRAFHTIGLSPDYSERMVKLEFDTVCPGYELGKITDMYICPPLAYVRNYVRNMALPCLLSFLVFFFGIVLAMVYIWIPDKSRLPFDIAALGMMAFLMGLWLVIDTRILQLLAGHIYIWRGLNRTLIFLVGYPLVGFFNSLTKQKRPIYHRLAIYSSILPVGAMIGLRYLIGLDMLFSFPSFIIVFIFSISILTCILFIDDNIYCRANGIVNNRWFFYIGVAAFIGCGLVDFTLYATGVAANGSFGFFTRLGMFVFIAVMLFQFLTWWTSDQESIERDRFINRAAQSAVISENSELGIRSMLEFIGNELEVRRILIFEGRQDGKFQGTYEWFREGLKTASADLLHIPYDGFIDGLYEDFKAHDHRLIVDNVEAYREVNPDLYNLLKTNNIENMVAAPLEADDKLIGIFALFNAQAGMLKQVSEIIGLVSYFLTQLIRQRDEQQRLSFYSYNDSLSGTLNRRAYREYIENRLDKGSAFGYLICEINILRDFKGFQGYESEDRMVVDMAGIMMDVFGKDNVYRLGSSEFAAFGFETEEAFFMNDVERVRKQAVEKDLPIFTGSVYCTYGTMDIEKVIKRANELLREERAGKAYNGKQ